MEGLVEVSGGWQKGQAPQKRQGDIITRFLLTPVGSAGDVNPYIGVGRALAARDHDVHVLTAEPFRAAVERAGLTFHATWSASAYDATTLHPDLWHPQKGLRLVLETAVATIREAYEVTARQVAPGRTVLVGHALSFATRQLEDAEQIPATTMVLAPAILRSNVRGPRLGPRLDLGHVPGWLARAIWWLADRMGVDPQLVPALNAWRRELGLPAIRRPFASWILSPRLALGLFPDWFAPPPPDWPTQLVLSGFPLFDDARPSTPGPLDAFLDAGEAPVVITPGSANRQAGPFFEAAIHGARSLGHRVLVVTDYPEQLPPHLQREVQSSTYAPFSRLFPRCAAVIHHGGIGTVSQALAAGIPQLVIPLAFDQFDNAARVARLGVGASLPGSIATPARIATTLRRLLTAPSVRASCKRVHDRLATDDAIPRICEHLETLAPH